MRVQSAKNKGRRLQQQTRDALLKARPDLHPDDIRSTSMGADGEDIQMSKAAREIYPYSIECKNVEKLNIWEAIYQSRSNCGGHTPVVVFSKNHEAPWIALPLDDFLKLHKVDKDENK